MTGYRELSKEKKFDVTWLSGNIFLGEKFGSRAALAVMKIRVYLDLFSLWPFGSWLVAVVLLGILHMLV